MLSKPLPVLPVTPERAQKTNFTLPHSANTTMRQLSIVNSSLFFGLTENRKIAGGHAGKQVPWPLAPNSHGGQGHSGLLIQKPLIEL